MQNSNSNTFNAQVLGGTAFQRMTVEKCGCGEKVRYMTTTGMACNKSARCLTYHELRQRCFQQAVEIASLKEQLKNLENN